MQQVLRIVTEKNDIDRQLMEASVVFMAEEAGSNPDASDALLKTKTDLRLLSEYNGMISRSWELKSEIEGADRRAMLAQAASFNASREREEKSSYQQFLAQSVSSLENRKLELEQETREMMAGEVGRKPDSDGN